jgi:hypothetical protein
MIYKKWSKNIALGEYTTKLGYVAKMEEVLVGESI